jgi:hypothetical protein
MKSRPVPGWKLKVNGFLRPRLQIERLAPLALVKKGLSLGMLPSGLIRSSLPSRFASVWELAEFEFSPTAM